MLVHDTVLQHTFAPDDFGAPWSQPALVNGDIGLTFRISYAQNSLQWKKGQSQSFFYDPWAESNHDASFRLRDSLAKTLRESTGGRVKHVAVFVHGFGDSGSGCVHHQGDATFGSWPAISASMFSALDPTRNVGIALDWERSAARSLHYSVAMSSARVVGLYLARLVEAAHDAFGPRIRTWCVGHSLGAHACGISGKYSKRLGIPGWNMISALDPAGPSVTSCRILCPSWVDPRFSRARLEPDDAEFTEVLYTDWGGLGFHPTLAGCISKHHRYVFWHFKHCSRPAVRLGHREVFLNPEYYTASGKLLSSLLPDQAFMQPGCSLWQTMFGCSHRYAIQLFLFGLKDLLEGGCGLQVNQRCGVVDRAIDPLHVCPHGRHVETNPILAPPETRLRAGYIWGCFPGFVVMLGGQVYHPGSYCLDAVSPGVAQLAAFFPNTGQPGASTSSQCAPPDVLRTDDVRRQGLTLRCMRGKRIVRRFTTEGE